MLVLVYVFQHWLTVNGAPSYTPVRVIVSADHSDWNYRLGESVIFSVSVYKNGNPIEAKVQYKIMPEKMDPIDAGILHLENGRAELQASADEDTRLS